MNLVAALRLVHILFGIIWVGATLLLAWFVLPSVRSAGPGAQRFMAELMVRRRLPIVLMVSALLTMAAGLALFGQLYGSGWAQTRAGLALGLGGLAALLAALLGGVVGAPAGRRMASLQEAVAANGGPPSEAQRAEMERLGRRSLLTVRLVSVLLLVASSLMAVARHL